MHITDTSLANQPICPLGMEPTTQVLPASGVDNSMTAQAAAANLSNAMDFIWQRSVVGNVDPASTAGSPMAKLTPPDFHSLGLIYQFNEVSKNKQQLDMTKIPNVILQMAYLKLYILLSMHATSPLTKIQSNYGIKYHKIPWGNGAGHQSLDESIFPAKNSLSECLFLQA